MSLVNDRGNHPRAFTKPHSEAVHLKEVAFGRSHAAAWTGAGAADAVSLGCVYKPDNVDVSGMVVVLFAFCWAVVVLVCCI